MFGTVESVRLIPFDTQIIETLWTISSPGATGTLPTTISFSDPLLAKLSVSRMIWPHSATGTLVYLDQTPQSIYNIDLQSRQLHLIQSTPGAYSLTPDLGKALFEGVHYSEPGTMSRTAQNLKYASFLDNDRTLLAIGGGIYAIEPNGNMRTIVGPLSFASLAEVFNGIHITDLPYSLYAGSTTLPPSVNTVHITIRAYASETAPIYASVNKDGVVVPIFNSGRLPGVWDYSHPAPGLNVSDYVFPNFRGLTSIDDTYYFIPAINRPGNTIYKLQNGTIQVETLLTKCLPNHSTTSSGITLNNTVILNRLSVDRNQKILYISGSSAYPGSAPFMCSYNLSSKETLHITGSPSATGPAPSHTLLAETAVYPQSTPLLATPLPTGDVLISAGSGLYKLNKLTGVLTPIYQRLSTQQQTATPSSTPIPLKDAYLFINEAVPVGTQSVLFPSGWNALAPALLNLNTLTVSTLPVSVVVTASTDTGTLLLRGLSTNPSYPGYTLATYELG